MTTVVSPSLLACDFLNIESELNAFNDFENMWFHLDIMDGHFVPNLTFGHPIIKLISSKTSIPLDAHLMVDNPEFYVDSFKDFGLKNLTWHIEAPTENHLELIKKAKKHYPSVGLSIKPKTDMNQLTDELLSAVDLVLVMSVEPGFGGQKFIKDSFQRVEHLKQKKADLKLDFIIQVDGGVNDSNSSELIKAGADNLVAGSYVFKEGSEKYLERVNSLR